MANKDLKEIKVSAFMDEKEAEKAGLTKKIDQATFEALSWLARATKLAYWELYSIYEQTCPNEIDSSDLYTRMEFPKKDGSKRTIFEPNPLLKKVQTAIDKGILSKYSRHHCSFGFSGGSLEMAIIPHLESRVLLSFDIRNAFHSTQKEEVLASLQRYSFKEKPWDSQIPSVINFLKQGKSLPDINPNELSLRVVLPKGVPEIISQICTFPVNQGKGFVLPQGAPTSPKLFDLVMRLVDEQLSDLAKKTNGRYTRYADNLWFSLPDETFPNELKEMILEIVRHAGQTRFYKNYFRLHKIKVRELSSETACRILGLNIINGEIYNTREFKRRLRAVIFYLEKTIENQKNPSHLLNVLHGMMGFVRRENLTPSIEKQYQEVLKLIKCVSF